AMATVAPSAMSATACSGDETILFMAILASSRLRHAQDELAEEIASGHDLVRAGGFFHLERAAHHATQAAVGHHVHHGGKAAATPCPTAHERQGPPLLQGQVERGLR